MHRDRAGPIDPASINELKYAMTCYNAFSVFISVYFMKAKSNTPTAFKQVLYDIAPYGYVKKKKIRFDFGEECKSVELCSILGDNHIKHGK